MWDSAIVVAKYAERWADRYKGRRCLDLSAGCGLVGEGPIPLLDVSRKTSLEL